MKSARGNYFFAPTTFIDSMTTGVRGTSWYMPLEPVGASKAMMALRLQLEKLAQHDTWILILGEPGTGKESLARWLHAHGPRRSQAASVSAWAC